MISDGKTAPESDSNPYGAPKSMEGTSGPLQRLEAQPIPIRLFVSVMVLGISVAASLGAVAVLVVQAVGPPPFPGIEDWLMAPLSSAFVGAGSSIPFCIVGGAVFRFLFGDELSKGQAIGASLCVGATVGVFSVRSMLNQPLLEILAGGLIGSIGAFSGVGL